MTKQCKYVLNQIRILTNNTSCEFSYMHEKNYIYKVHAINDKLALNKYPGELSSIISSLLEDGYLTASRMGLQLTHKGLHPYRVSLEEIKRFLVKSILIPILISALASLLTMYLKGLL